MDRAARRDAPLDGRVLVAGEVVEPGWLGILPRGADELPLEALRSETHLLLLGGAPLGEDVAMLWNVVARRRDEVQEAYFDWEQRTDRFGSVPSSLARIEAPRPPWM